jgi:hypothetical protein
VCVDLEPMLYHPDSLNIMIEENSVDWLIWITFHIPCTYAVHSFIEKISTYHPVCSSTRLAQCIVFVWLLMQIEGEIYYVLIELYR